MSDDRQSGDVDPQSLRGYRSWAEAVGTTIMEHRHWVRWELEGIGFPLGLHLRRAAGLDQ